MELSRRKLLQTTACGFGYLALNALVGLDSQSRALEVREWVKDGGSPKVLRDPEELGAACLRGAVNSKGRAPKG